MSIYIFFMNHSIEKELTMLGIQCEQEIKDITQKYSDLRKKVHEKYTEPKKYTRKSIPKALKNIVWDTNIGEEKGIGKCYCCGQKINSKHFEAGHIIAVKNGGGNTLENLKPICSCCNKSMGTMNMNDFIQTYMQHVNRPTSVIPIINKNIKKHIPDIKKSFPSVETKISYNQPYESFDLLQQYPRDVYIQTPTIVTPIENKEEWFGTYIEPNYFKKKHTYQRRCNHSPRVGRNSMDGCDIYQQLSGRWVARDATVTPKRRIGRYPTEDAAVAAWKQHTQHCM